MVSVMLASKADKKKFLSGMKMIIINNFNQRSFIPGIGTDYGFLIMVEAQGAQ